MKFKRLIATVLSCCIVFSMIPSFVSAKGPTLKEGNHVAWIDRLGDMPQYALDFYDWLADNSVEGGALRTAQGDTNFSDGTSAHFVTEIQGTANAFTFPIGATDSTIQTNAINACAEARNAVVEDVKSFMFATIGAFDRDYPQVFWLEGNSSVAYSTGYSWSISRASGTGTAVFSVKIYYILKSSTFDIRNSKYSSAEIINETDKKINDCIDKILADNFPKDGTYLEKIRYINGWLTKNNCFNTTSGNSAYDFDTRECVSALEGRVGMSGPICEGYSRAFKVLCDRIGIPCVLVDGTAFNGVSSGGHMWNYVQMENGKWYAVDVSWNDPTVAGISSAVSGYENEKYFLIGSGTKISGTEFIVSHPVSNTVYTNGFEYTNGPVLSELSYQEDIAAEGELLSKLQFAGVQLSIADEINLRFFVNRTTFDNAGFSGPVVNATFGNNTYELQGIATTVSGVSYYMFVFENIPPHKMNDTVSVALSAQYNNKTVQGANIETSVAKYAYNQLESTTNTKLRTLLVDMLRYGAKAQMYMKHNITDLVDSELTATQASWGTQNLRELVSTASTPDFDGTVKWLGTSLNLQNKVKIQGFFTAATATGLKVEVTNSAGKIMQTITENDFVVESVSSGISTISFIYEKLSAGQMSETVGFTVYNSDGENLSGTLLYSVESYAQRNQNSSNTNLANLLKAMMMYGDSARAYAG